MSMFPLKFKTEDGYTYYILATGRVVDSLDPEKEDMSWHDITEFRESQASNNSCNTKQNLL